MTVNPINVFWVSSSSLRSRAWLSVTEDSCVAYFCNYNGEREEDGGKLTFEILVRTGFGAYATSSIGNVLRRIYEDQTHLLIRRGTFARPALLDLGPFRKLRT